MQNILQSTATGCNLSPSPWLEQASSTYGGATNLPSVNHPCPPRFDYYQVTVPKWVTIRQLFKILAEVFDGVEPDPIPCQQKQYAYCHQLKAEHGSVLFFSGGYNGEKYGINICAKGRLADDIARVLLQLDIEYSLSRADVCQDFRGSYSGTKAVIKRQCKRGRMTVTETGEVTDTDALKCRTLYGGGKTSVYQLLCYEKGLQLGAGCPEDYLRIEHRFRPKSFAKKAYAQLSAMEMLGTHKVARSLSREILHEEIQAFNLALPSREKDRYKHCLISCGKLLTHHFDYYGLEQGAQIIVDDVKRMEEERLRSRRMH